MPPINGLKRVLRVAARFYKYFVPTGLDESQSTLRFDENQTNHRADYRAQRVFRLAEVSRVCLRLVRRVRQERRDGHAGGGRAPHGRQRAGDLPQA